MKSILSVMMLLAMVGTLMVSSCDAVEDIQACLSEFAEYQDRAEAYAEIEGSLCDNQAAAQEFIDFLENDAKGSCIEEQLDAQGQSLDDIIANAKADLAACPQ